MDKQIDVCLSPRLIDLFELHGKNVVVIDILRAGSMMVTALAEGARAVIPVYDIARCRAMAGEDVILAAERKGEVVAGFRYGNSPLQYLDNPEIQGKTIALTTTNGTYTINACQGAKNIIIGSFLNIDAVVAWLDRMPDDALLVCAGWKNQFNMEDTLFAGAVVERLKSFTTGHSDPAWAARILYQSARNDLYEFLQKSSHFNRLRHLGIEEDIRFCLTFNRYRIVPVLRNGRIVTE